MATAASYSDTLGHPCRSEEIVRRNLEVLPGCKHIAPGRLPPPSHQ